MIRRFFVFCVVLVAASTATAQRKADLSRLVVVGDSLSAGFQNFSLVQSGQVNGYAALLARQAATPLALPLIAEPGIPNKLVLIAQPPWIGQAPGLSTGRIDPTVQATNLAVPGHTVLDALGRQPSIPIVNPVDQVQTLTNFVLGFPGLYFGGIAKSQVEWVEAFAANPATRPTTIVVWLGNNDALFSVLAANPMLLTPPDVFGVLYQQVMNRLAPAGATLVVADIPDVTSIPYLTAAERVVLPIAALLNVPAAYVYLTLGLSPGDYLTPGAVMKIQEIIAQPTLTPLPGTCPVLLPGLPFTETPCVLRAAQIATIQAAVRAYNTVIADRARAAGAVRVEIAALVQALAARGYEAGGKRLTTDFLGGLFSLDGVHPSNTGYAIIANEFIKAINQQADSEIPPLSIRQVAATDPLVFGLPGSKVGSQ